MEIIKKKTGYNSRSYAIAGRNGCLCWFICLPFE